VVSVHTVVTRATTQHTCQDQLPVRATFEGGSAWHDEREVLVAVRCVVGKVRATAVERARPLDIDRGGIVLPNGFEFWSALLQQRWGAVCAWVCEHRST